MKSIADAIKEQVAIKQAGNYITTLIAAPIFLGLLDNLDDSGLAQRKAKYHLKGLIAELEKMDPDIADVWKRDPLNYYYSMDGFEAAIKFVASLTHLHLQSIGRHGITINYKEDENVPTTYIAPSGRENKLLPPPKEEE